MSEPRDRHWSSLLRPDNAEPETMNPEQSTSKVTSDAFNVVWTRRCRSHKAIIRKNGEVIYLDFCADCGEPL